MSYASDVTSTILNRITIKYCFNAADISSSGNMAGIVASIYSYVGTNGYNGLPDSNPMRSGKLDTYISYNYNIGNIVCTGNASAGGIIMGLYNYIYSVNCFSAVFIANNFSAKDVNVAGLSYYVGGIFGVIVVSDFNNQQPTTVELDILNCYSYSTSISGGSDSYRGGVVGRFADNNHSSTTLSNCYSAYKRETDSNTYGYNPATRGANVGGGRGGATAPLFVVSIALVIIQIV